MDKIGRYEFRADPFHCDCTGKLFMGHLGNHMLNAADFHANDRDFGIRYLQTINKAWVLSRLAIEMERMPEIYERFYVESWIESSMRFFTNRSFRVVGMDGQVYGYGKSIWAMSAYAFTPVCSTATCLSSREATSACIALRLTMCPCSLSAR